MILILPVGWRAGYLEARQGHRRVAIATRRRTETPRRADRLTTVSPGRGGTGRVPSAHDHADRGPSEERSTLTKRRTVLRSNLIRRRDGAGGQPLRHQRMDLGMALRVLLHQPTRRDFRR